VSCLTQAFLDQLFRQTSLLTIFADRDTSLLRIIFPDTANEYKVIRLNS